jgi:TonB family protein
MCLLAVAGPSRAIAGTTVVPARLIEATQPKVPQDGGGWVDVSYVVLPDGTVGDLIIVDSSGTPALEAAVTEAVGTRKYAPATRDGQPVPQRMDDRLVVLKTSADKYPMRERREKAFKRINKLIDEGRLDAAELALEQLRAEPDLSYPVWGNIHWFLARVDAARSDLQGQLRNLLEAVRYVSPTNAPVVLRTLFDLQVRLHLYRSALQTYAVLRSFGPGASNDALDSNAEAIREAATRPMGFNVPGEIAANRPGAAEGVWIYELVGRRLIIGDIAGSLGDLELRCDQRTFIDRIEGGKTWTVPASWGDCAVLISGRPGTRFVVIDAPVSPDAAGAPATD